MSELTQYYAPSKNIRIFPYSEDRSTDPFGKHLSEHNLRKLITQFTTYDSFFVGIDEISSDEGILNRRIKFCIAGHYVEFILSIDTNNATSDTNAFWLNNYIYAEVEHYNEASQNPSITVTYEKMLGKDNLSGVFEGVKFVTGEEHDAIRSESEGEYTEEDGESIVTVNTIKTRFRLFNPIYNGSISELDGVTFTAALQSAIPDTAYERFDHNTFPSFQWYTLTPPSIS